MVVVVHVVLGLFITTFLQSPIIKIIKISLP
jgi:hypothetical protein